MPAPAVLSVDSSYLFVFDFYVKILKNGEVIKQLKSDVGSMSAIVRVFPYSMFWENTGKFEVKRGQIQDRICPRFSPHDSGS